MKTYITQLIYLKANQEAVFNEFESLAIPIISQYNGKLLLRVRTDKNSIIDSSIETPYEIHIVEFNSLNDFENFKLDEERKAFLHLKEKSIKSTLMIQGHKL